ncbi:MAG: hypothetical protein KUG75_13440 [Pseudomonadales bacterium]|nr:hypothetical protein [Pseudomonadales bacterium]
MKYLLGALACYVLLILTQHSLLNASLSDSPGGNGWFCEKQENREDWICVPSKPIKSAAVGALVYPDLKETPEPTGVLAIDKRTYDTLTETDSTQQIQHSPALQAISTELAQTSNTDGLDTKNVRQTKSESSENNSVAEIVDHTHKNTGVSDTQQSATYESLPLYMQLSHAPGEVSNISELPPEFYVVQIISVSRKEDLETYFVEHNLNDLAAARVERDEKIFYVLLLGIYETYDKAKMASENMPSQLKHEKPWIRRLGSLQKAMIRADDLVGSARY